MGTAYEFRKVQITEQWGILSVHQRAWKMLQLKTEDKREMLFK